ncbi:hypothetical protein SAMN02910317_02497 [Ruminococcaceae bacterium FB2012]|nr:hypothetical protein SAMN02910317_02497 [Ruminococcaceae bacterium FB2012]
MEPNNKPRAREKFMAEGDGNAKKKGEGLNTGPVGSQDGYAGRRRRPEGSGETISTGGGFAGNPNVKRAAIGGAVLIPVIIIAVILFVKFGGGMEALNGGDTLPGNFGGDTTGGYSQNSPIAVDNTVASGSRAKYTSIKGGGNDKITIMVYMCGTDLESKHSMASSDLNEMAQADLGDKINIIVYTGGCKKWKTTGISNDVNQIYQVQKGGLKQLVSDDGNKSMVDPSTLSNFIKYCSSNFPADRNELILWDHGGGSVTGYGYDEKNTRKGSMSLDGINRALKDGGVKFDFVGFDACLMATAETALMLNQHGDYMIASEETEPGIGWYYTDWLNKLAKNTSMPTVEIGKNIVDSFVETCAAKCRGQQTTLSVTDLAEFANTVPSKISAFSRSVSSMIESKDYQAISDARYKTREFARSSKIDQVDFVNLAENVSNDEGKALSEAIKKAVKYNRTSSNMTNAYGISIYFPYQRASMVDSAVSTYSSIGMDQDYSKCIRQFAGLQTSGQIAAQGTASPLAALFGGGSQGSSGDSNVIASLLSGFLGGSGKSISGLDESNTAFMKDTDQQQAAQYLSENYFKTDNLNWKTQDDKYYLDIPSEQWKLIHKLDLNMFLDDGAGYLNLGLDNVYTFDGDKMIASTGKNWLAINGQTVAYYHLDTVEDGNRYMITGYVPALLNGERIKLLLAFDTEHPEGYISGAVSDYQGVETDLEGKALTGLEPGDKLEFICDYYSYDQEYQNTYILGEPVTVTENMTIKNVSVGENSKVKLTYRFTDIYNQAYWTDAIDL